MLSHGNPTLLKWQFEFSFWLLCRMTRSKKNCKVKMKLKNMKTMRQRWNVFNMVFTLSLWYFFSFSSKWDSHKRATRKCIVPCSLPFIIFVSRASTSSLLIINCCVVMDLRGVRGLVRSRCCCCCYFSSSFASFYFCKIFFVVKNSVDECMRVSRLVPFRLFHSVFFTTQLYFHRGFCDVNNWQWLGLSDEPISLTNKTCCLHSVNQKNNEEYRRLKMFV